MQRVAVVGGGRRELKALEARGIEAVAIAGEDPLSLLDAIRAARCGAVWLPGDNIELASRCAGLGIAVIGPSAESLKAAPKGRGSLEVFVANGKAIAAAERLPSGLARAPAAIPPGAEKAGWRGLAVVHFERGAVVGVAPQSSAEAAIEESTGIDLVELRLALHEGEAPPAPAASRAAIVAPIVVAAGPWDGEVVLLRLPGGPGLRAEALLAEGTKVPAGREATIAIVCASGRDPADAERRLEVALDECAVVVTGRATSRGAGQKSPARARIAAAVFDYEALQKTELERFLAEGRRGRPRTDAPAGRIIELTDDSGPHRLRVAQLGPDEFRVGDEVVQLERRGPYEARLGGSVVLHSRRGAHFIEIDGVGHVVEGDRRGVVCAAMPAVVQRVLVQEGARVEKGQQLAVLEAMKLEAPVFATEAGRVARVLVSPNQQVASGAPLIALEPDEEAPRAIDPAAPRPGARAPAAELRRLLLGYDDDGWTAKSLAAAIRSAPEVADFEALSTFAALIKLFRREHNGDLRPPLEDLLRYLRMGTEPPAPVEAALAEHGGDRDLALLRIWKARPRVEQLQPAVLALLEKRVGSDAPDDPRWRALLDRLIAGARGSFPAVAGLARELRFEWFDKPVFRTARDAVLEQAEADLRNLDADACRRLVEVTWPLSKRLIEAMVPAPPAARGKLVEVLLRRYHRVRELEAIGNFDLRGLQGARAEYVRNGRRIRLLACFAATGRVREALAQLAKATSDAPRDIDIALELYLCDLPPSPDPDELSNRLRDAIANAGFDRLVRRAACVVGGSCFTFRPGEKGYSEERHLRGVHPMLAKRLQLDRLANFELTRLPGGDDVYLFHGRARENPKDERFFALSEVRDLTPLRDEAGRVAHLPQLEHVLHETFAALRLAQARRADPERLEWNRVLLTISAPFTYSKEETLDIARRLAPEADGLGLEMLLLSVRTPEREALIRIFAPDQHGLRVRWDEPSTHPLQTLGEYQQRVVQLRRRGLVYPYEIVKLFTPSAEASQADFPPGDFVEHDLDAANALVPIARPSGQNTARIVAGVISNWTPRHPEGMKRVMLLGDASREMGAVAEPECRRIIAALDLAQKLQVPVEWFALSAGARIALESGTENMDWVARALRRIVQFTQAGGEINVVVAGINVGAQPYWNAEATMLMHTRGILIMTPASAMVLTGKQALEYSGGVSAEDNQGIGGYDRIMGPNGQAQYWAPDLVRACALLLEHYEHTFVAPGERFPRKDATSDPRDRDVCQSPHPGSEFATVGDVFSSEKNPERKKPFDIRAVMASVVDQDHSPLERWRDLRGGETAVVWDAHLGGQPVCLLGIESQTTARKGFVPGDGPDAWSGGTLFPLSSKKIARAINAASGNRPVVVLANLSGFDGSPESMRRLQLEYGAEIGRAVVNFDGPIVFCVVSRYHGGAFVVFSRWLRENMQVLAVEGARASVIGGAPAAAVVFSREVEARARKDPRFAGEPAAVRAQKMGELAAEYDRIHDIERSLRVGSVERVIAARQLRPALIEAVERGMART